MHSSARALSCALKMNRFRYVGIPEEPTDHADEMLTAYRSMEATADHCSTFASICLEAGAKFKQHAAITTFVPYLPARCTSSTVEVLEKII